jgi:hypothetical protein
MGPCQAQESSSGVSLAFLILLATATPLLLVKPASAVVHPAGPNYIPCNYYTTVYYMDTPSNGGTINTFTNGQSQYRQYNNVPCQDNKFGYQEQATPTPGYAFGNWTVSGGTLSSTTANPTYLTMSADATAYIRAHYAYSPYYSNGNEGVNISGISTSAVTVTLNQAITSSGNSPWSYQFNLLWYNATCINNWCISQTTIEVSSNSCQIGTGYTTSDPHETQNSVSCSTVTQSGDNWEVITSWNGKGSLTSLQFNLNGNELYSLTQSQICTGYSPNCSINDLNAYFQSVFVGANNAYPSVTFTSLLGQMTYSGLKSLLPTYYPICTSEYSNSIYSSIQSSTQPFGYSGSPVKHCI